MWLVLSGALLVGVLFYFKRSGDTRANRIYGTLLVFGGFTQLHFLWDFLGWFAYYPELRYLPVYFSLWLPVLLFLHVKVSLFPLYRFRWTDAKHLLLPGAQLLYFLGIWLFPVFRHEDGRFAYNPFYGTTEQLLFLVGWPLYILFSVLYLRNRQRQKRYQSLPRLLWYIRKLLKGCLLFMLAYALLASADYLINAYFYAHLRQSGWYAGAQALSYTVLLTWLCAYGVQVLIWGRKLMRQ